MVEAAGLKYAQDLPVNSTVVTSRLHNKMLGMRTLFNMNGHFK